MEILIRNYHDTNYIWKPAEYCNGNYYVTDEEYGREKVTQINILSVRDDYRINMVVCSYCGEIIENNPEAIELHYAKNEAKRDCFKCDDLRTYEDKHNRNVTYEPNNDGTYRVTKVYDSELVCGRSYWDYNINNDHVKSYCPHFQCRRSGVQSFNDTFIKYPEPFVRQLTVDALNKKKYPFVGYRNGFFCYDMKMRGAVKALVNELGIIDHFLFDKRNGYSYWLFYSDKYNKLFFADRINYSDRLDSIMNETSQAQLLNKIAALYEEVNANE